MREPGAAVAQGMATDVLPNPETPFGKQVHERLQNEPVAWLTTVSRDGTPQPNPVWFLWTGDDEIIVYTFPSAHRLTHIAERPLVSLNLNSAADGGQIVVMRGKAERDDDLPPTAESPEYLAKYKERMAMVSGSVDAFSATYSVPLRIRVTRVRGF